jgi:hypothetical protein
MRPRTFMHTVTFVAIVLLTLPLTAAAQASRGAAGDPKLTQGFSVVLVLGDLKGDSSISSDLPPGARRALADMKDFLPYHSYKLLDSTWILSNTSSGSGRASSRLRGPDGVDYEVTVMAGVTYRRVAGSEQEPVLSVSFSLKDPGMGTEDATGTAAATEVARLESELTSLREKFGSQNPEVLKKAREVGAATSRLRRPARAIIETSFNMNGNETVVVGTSRVQGDSALIALLTAVPRGKEQ